MPHTYWIETLGCPKNQVDSDKLEGTLRTTGYSPAGQASAADLVVVNTCAFIEAARTESVEAILDMASHRKRGARLVVTGCMAERYGDELEKAIPEADLVAGFGVPVTFTEKRKSVPKFDLLNLPRPPSSAPWAYVKIAEGCDRSCGFCAIPDFRGKQRSRSIEAIIEEVDRLAVREVVLVAQDLASFGRDLGRSGSIIELVNRVTARVDRVRCLYLYPSDLSDDLIDAIGSSGTPYFDLSLQHVSKPLLRRMRRWGDKQRFVRRIADIRSRFPDAAFRSNFIVGYPGETETDHDELLSFVQEMQLDWCGFFRYSAEEGTYAAGLDAQVPVAIVDERLAELERLQADITMSRRAALIGTDVDVLVDAAGIGRSHREAPEIDGIIEVPLDLTVGEFHSVRITGVKGPDLVGEALAPAAV